MTETRNCGNCRHVHRQPHRDRDGKIVIGQEILTCRHSPPVPILIPTSHESANLTSQFPMVPPDLLCGQHERAANGAGK